MKNALLYIFVATHTSYLLQFQRFTALFKYLPLYKYKYNIYHTKIHTIISKNDYNHNNDDGNNYNIYNNIIIIQNQRKNVILYTYV